MKQRRPSSYVRAYLERLCEAGWWVKAADVDDEIVVRTHHYANDNIDEYEAAEDLETALKKLCERIGV